MSDDTPRGPRPELVASLARSDADLAAGRTVPLGDVLEELRRSAEELEARLRSRRSTQALARR